LRIQRNNIYLRTDVHYFDIIAEKEGFIALIKSEELRMLQKKDSLLVKEIFI